MEWGGGGAGELLEGWHVYPLQLDDPSVYDLQFKTTVPETLEAKKKAKAKRESDTDAIAARHALSHASAAEY